MPLLWCWLRAAAGADAESAIVQYALNWQMLDARLMAVTPLIAHGLVSPLQLKPARNSNKPFAKLSFIDTRRLFSQYHFDTFRTLTGLG